MKVCLSVEVRAADGAGPGQASADTLVLSAGQRLRRSALSLGVGLPIAVLFLAIPLIHIFGMIVFLASVSLAVRRFRIRALVERVRGHCPSCRQDTGFFVWGGLAPARWPLSSQCGACGIGVRLTPSVASALPAHEPG